MCSAVAAVAVDHALGCQMDPDILAAIARLMEEQERRAAARGQAAASGQSDPTIGEILDAYCAHRSAERNTAAARQVTEETDHARGVHVRPFWGGLRLSECSTEKVEEYRQLRAGQKTQYGRLTAVGTRNQEIIWLKAALNWAVETRRIMANPLDRAHCEPDPAHRETVVDRRQLEMLLRCAHPTLALMITVSWELGLRQGEVRMLRHDQIRDQLVTLSDGTREVAKVLVLPGRKTKTKRPRVIPLSETAAAAIAAAPTWPGCVWVFGNPRNGQLPIPKPTVYRWFRLARDRSCITGVDGEAVWFHSLRHSWATDMTANGCPWPAVRAGGGWQSEQVAARYQHVSPEILGVLREAMQARRAGPQATAPQPQKSTAVKK